MEILLQNKNQYRKLTFLDGCGDNARVMKNIQKILDIKKRVCVTLMMLAVLGTSYAIAQEVSDAVLVGENIGENKSEQIKTGEEKEMDTLGKLHEPLEAEMKAVNQTNKKLQARRNTILAENEEAATLSEEIAVIEKKLSEKQAFLSDIFNSNEELTALKEEARIRVESDFFRASANFKTNKESFQRHAERRAQAQSQRQKVGGVGKTTVTKEMKEGDPL